PGDIILLMNGNYSGAENQPAVASFISSGLPSAWITLKNYPGHQPVILCNGKDGVLIARGTQASQTNSPILAYLEIRGLTLKGNSEAVLRQNLPELGTSTPITETTGININGEYSPVRMYHHIRVADCIAEYCGADGIYADFTDYLAIENNILRYNCYTSAHWCMSGFTMMHYADFDKVDNVTKILVRGNQAYANQCKTYKKSGPFKIYNGNGFLFDASAEEYLAPDAYLGRTLVQNNLVYGNGGGGIQMWGSHRIDVVNNTMYYNGITPELKWGNMGFDYCKDIRVINNIVVAQPDRPLDFWEMPRDDRNTSNIIRINNLYFGGIKPNLKGVDDIVADPLFVNPSLDPSKADFRLKPGSPAINAGYTKLEALPVIDVVGDTRDVKSNSLERGAYKFNQLKK
ncbi:MAG: right-handed parallel beta-helix repeat-containing protein, partial [Ferruginibacter sp.]|nr:right-handed parallel beta-helix repeat-containing protein [Ferruginibacter sp.]